MVYMLLLLSYGIFDWSFGGIISFWGFMSTDLSLLEDNTQKRSSKHELAAGSTLFSVREKSSAAGTDGDRLRARKGVHIDGGQVANVRAFRNKIDSGFDKKEKSETLSVLKLNLKRPRGHQHIEKGIRRRKALCSQFFGTHVLDISIGFEWCIRSVGRLLLLAFLYIMR